MEFFKKILSKSQTLNAALGGVVCDNPKIRGQSSGAYIQVRLKENLDGSGHLFGIKLKPDFSAGAEGSPTNYLNLDIEKARQLKRHLEKCIDAHGKLARKQS